MPQDGVMPQVENKDRTEFGHLFKWNPENQEWETTTGCQVFVRAPGTINLFWLVRVPNSNREYQLVGENAEKRAFSIAEMYSRQAY